MARLVLQFSIALG